MTTAQVEAKLAQGAGPKPLTFYPLLDSTEFIELIEEKMMLEVLPPGYTTKSAVEARLKAIGEDIQALLAGAGTEAVQYRDGVVVKVGKGRTPDRIIPTRLLEAGVTIDQIARATEEGKEYTFAQIQTPKLTTKTK